MYNSYANFADKLGSRTSRKVANNTYLRRQDDGAIVVHYHTTDVLTYRADGTVTYNTGGWQTYSTKERFNTFGPDGVRVWSDRGTWYIGRHSGDYIPFVNGMTIDPAHLTASFVPYFADAERSAIEVRKLKRRISRFVATLDADRLATIVADASKSFGLTGDCLFCRAEHSALVADGRRAILLSGDHLLSHMDEDYHHASLILCALRWVGYREEQIPTVIRFGDIATRSLRRYLSSRLVTAPSAVAA